jgi:hypothetical protein
MRRSVSRMKRAILGPVFTSPLQRPFRTSGLAGFAAVAKQGAPGRSRLRVRIVSPGERTVEKRHTDNANGNSFVTKRSAIR